MRLESTPTGYRARGDAEFDVNAGDLCMMGFASAETLDHPERLLGPLVRRDGVLQSATWDEALDAAAQGFRAVRASRGPDAVAAFGSGALTNEAAYAFGKFARLALGSDRGLLFPLTWLGEADMLLVAGGNPRETMPPSNATSYGNARAASASSSTRA